MYLGWEWSERYPEQPEIMRYMNYAADKLDLKKDIQFNTKVTSADWDEAGNRWVLRTEQGARYSATYLITAIGCLSAANVPDVPGRDGFKGE